MKSCLAGSAAVVLVLGCARPSNAPVPLAISAKEASAIPSSANEKDADRRPSELGALVSKTYRTMKELEFEARITDPDMSITCRAKCTNEGRHHLEVRDKGGTLIYSLDQDALAFDRMNIQENCFRSGKSASYTLTKLDFGHDVWNPLFTTTDDLGFSGCLFGECQRSWLGEDSRRAEFWGRIISEGTYQGMKVLNGTPCLVVATGRLHRPGEELWIDPSTGLVRRWRDVARDTVYEYSSQLKAVASAD